MDTLIRKAWELYQHTAHFRVETILTATVWLEEKHRKAPSDKVALAIAVHYLLLALRQDLDMESVRSRRSIALAPRAGRLWRAVGRSPISPRKCRGSTDAQLDC